MKESSHSTSLLEQKNARPRAGAGHSSALGEIHVQRPSYFDDVIVFNLFNQSRDNLFAKLTFSLHIFVGAGKFLGVRRNFARILPNLREKSYRAPGDLQKKAFHINSGAIFKSKHVECHLCSDFQGVSEGSQRCCLNFMGFCLDFHQIKTFRGEVAPPPPTPVPFAHLLPVCSRQGPFQHLFTSKRLFSLVHRV